MAADATAAATDGVLVAVGVKRKAPDTEERVVTVEDARFVSSLMQWTVEEADAWLCGRRTPSGQNTDLGVWSHLSYAVDKQHNEPASRHAFPLCCTADGACHMKRFVEAAVAFHGLNLRRSAFRFETSFNSARFCVARAILPYVSREQLEANESDEWRCAPTFHVNGGSSSTISVLISRNLPSIPRDILKSVISTVSAEHLNRVGALAHAISKHNVAAVEVLLDTIDETRPREGQLDINDDVLGHSCRNLRGGRVLEYSCDYQEGMFHTSAVIRRLVYNKNTRLNQAAPRHVTVALVAARIDAIPAVLLPLIGDYAADFVAL